MALGAILPTNNAGSVTNNVADLGSSLYKFKDLYLSGTANFGSLSDGIITITGFVDEDNMSSDSATQLATQQSIKAYVDSQVTAQDLDLTTDSGTIAIDLDSETLTITGGTGIATSAATNTVTLALDLNEVTTETSIAQDDFVTMVDATDSGSGKITFSNLEDTIFGNVSGDIAIAAGGAATIQANSVALSTDTTGDYVSTITAGTGLTSTGATSGEGIAHSLSVDASQTQITAVGTIGTGTWQGTAIADAYVADNLTISGGTVDNSVIGGTTAAAGTFTTLTANTSITGTLATAAQTNVTSLGTLSSLIGRFILNSTFNIIIYITK